MAAKTATNSRDVAAELAYLTRALKAPTLRGAIEQLADRARTKTWSYEEFLAACLQREVSARESHGGEGRIRAARFPSRKSLEEFDFDQRPRSQTRHHSASGHPGLRHPSNRDRDPRLPGRPPRPIRHRLAMG